MSNTSVKHVARDYCLKSYIESRVDDLKNKLTKQLDNENFQLNSDVNGKFDFIPPDEDISKIYMC